MSDPRNDRRLKSAWRDLRLALAVALSLSACAPPPHAAEQVQQPSIAESYLQLSEQGGYFDSDNLISN